MARILVVDDSPTLRKVVTGILERRGYETVAAADGQLALDALAEDDRVNLVLLDFVMPRMNGFQFCRAIRSSHRWSTLPVVLMSAKSDRIRDQFVEQTGALDAISKPFDAQALVAAIENALRRVGEGRASQARLPDVDDLDVITAHGPSSLSPRDASQQMARALVQVSARLGDLLAPTLGRLSPQVLSDRTKLGASLGKALSYDAVRDLTRSLRDVEGAGEGPVALAGDIGAIPIGAVLQMLQVESQTGVMSVTHGKSDVRITMRRGLIDLVQSRGAGDEFRLGRYFVEEGLVTPADIDTLLADAGAGTASAPPVSAARPGAQASRHTNGENGRRAPVPSELPKGKPLLGDLLLQSGRVNADQLTAALARQSSELIYEVLRWPAGRFEFRVQPVATLAQRAQLALPVASVVMEGFRRVDEWRLVEDSLGSFESVLVPDPIALEAVPKSGSGELSRPERVVLDVVDGHRSVREIIAASHMSSFDACRILMQLLEARLVRRRPG